MVSKWLVPPRILNGEFHWELCVGFVGFSVYFSHDVNWSIITSKLSINALGGNALVGVLRWVEQFLSIMDGREIEFKLPVMPRCLVKAVLFV